MIKQASNLANNQEVNFTVNKAIMRVGGMMGKMVDSQVCGIRMHGER